MEFKLWSETSIEAKKELKPDMGFRSWDSLTEEEKYKIWNHLEIHFFNPKVKYDHQGNLTTYSGENSEYYSFEEPYQEDKRNRISYTIVYIHDVCRVNNYAKNFLINRTYHNACKDFRTIFMNESENVVFELLSVYTKKLIEEFEDKYYRYKSQEENNEDFEKERKEWKDKNFANFADELNIVFADFGLKVHMTKTGFIPRQDDKILTDIFEPALKCLADDKWKEVNNILSDAFAEYRKNTKNGYSTCVTHTVSAVQAFLQILVKGKTGSGDISKLIIQAQNDNLIPQDMFTKEVFNTIEKVLMRERQETGDPHPKKSYATEKNAKMVLNLAMVFIQHSLTT